MQKEKQINNLSVLKKTIACNLRKLRAQNGWDLEEASEKLRIKLKQLVLMGEGINIKSINTLYYLAKGYDVEIIDLLK